MLAALLLATCSREADTEPTVGGLGVNPIAGSGCLPLHYGGKLHTEVTSAWEVLENGSSDPVTITGVDFTDPRGVELTDARIVTLPSKRGYTLVGNVIGTDYSAGAQRWIDRSRAAVGGTVAPGEEVSVILFLRTTGGEAGRLRVNYEDADGGEHLWVGGSDWVFMPDCDAWRNAP